MNPLRLFGPLPKICGLVAILVHATSIAQSNGEVSISHYFTGELGLKSFQAQVAKFEARSGITLKNSPVGHEDFKTDILVRAAGNSLPDVFSYWAGARVQFVVDSGSLYPIDAMWNKQGLDDVIAKSVADSATLYDGKRYLVPFNYHYSGLFYNKNTLKEAGADTLPQTWDEFLALCAKLKENDITPIALGSKNRWPSQFWFDYLLLQTAGPDYRAQLMEGSAAYTDPQVVTAIEHWKALTDQGYFTENANADTWTDAADKVARGDAAMTLMGTWITGYWNGIGLVPGDDYDFFPFPSIDRGQPNSVVGPVDGLVISANAKNRAGAEQFLAFMVKNTDVQTNWTKEFGALSANTSVNPSSYNAVMQRAVATVADADTFAFNYDLATPPPVAEVGLSMFAQFMDDPSQYESLLQQTQESAATAFKK